MEEDIVRPSLDSLGSQVLEVTEAAAPKNGGVIADEIAALTRRIQNGNIRRCLPGSAAVGRVLQTMATTLTSYFKKGGYPPTRSKPKETPQLVGGMLNFGYSGGASIDGSHLLAPRWEDIQQTMSSLGCD